MNDQKSPDALIRFENVDLGYSSTPVLSSVNFEITKGDFVGIVGPNGVGKTTLLRGILGSLSPLRGRLTYPSGDKSGIHFGYIPQRQALDDAFPLSVMDVVLMGRCRLIGIGQAAKPVDRDHARLALEQVSLLDLADSLYRDLSGGQKQRALIARALAGEPDILILDEPTTDLDIAGQRSVMDLLAGLHSDSGMTVIVVSHLLHHVMNYAKIIGLVENNSVRLQPVEHAITAENLSALYGIDVKVAEVDDQRFVL